MASNLGFRLRHDFQLATATPLGEDTSPREAAVHQDNVAAADAYLQQFGADIIRENQRANAAGFCEPGEHTGGHRDKGNDDAHCQGVGHEGPGPGDSGGDHRHADRDEDGAKQDHLSLLSLALGRPARHLMVAVPSSLPGTDSDGCGGHYYSEKQGVPDVYPPGVSGVVDTTQPPIVSIGLRNQNMADSYGKWLGSGQGPGLPVSQVKRVVQDSDRECSIATWAFAQESLSLVPSDAHGQAVFRSWRDKYMSGGNTEALIWSWGLPPDQIVQDMRSETNLSFTSAGYSNNNALQTLTDLISQEGRPIIAMDNGTTICSNAHYVCPIAWSNLPQPASDSEILFNYTGKEFDVSANNNFTLISHMKLDEFDKGWSMIATKNLLNGLQIAALAGAITALTEAGAPLFVTSWANFLGSYTLFSLGMATYSRISSINAQLGRTIINPTATRLTYRVASISSKVPSQSNQLYLTNAFNYTDSWHDVLGSASNGPDGLADKHFKLNLTLPTNDPLEEVQVLATNANGIPSRIWSTNYRAAGYTPLKIGISGQPLLTIPANTNNANIVGVTGPNLFDVYLSDAGNVLAGPQRLIVNTRLRSGRSASVFYDLLLPGAAVAPTPAPTATPVPPPPPNADPSVRAFKYVDKSHDLLGLLTVGPNGLPDVHFQFTMQFNQRTTMSRVWLESPTGAYFYYPDTLWAGTDHSIPFSSRTQWRQEVLACLGNGLSMPPAGGVTQLGTYQPGSYTFDLYTDTASATQSVFQPPATRNCSWQLQVDSLVNGTGYRDRSSIIFLPS